MLVFYLVTKNIYTNPMCADPVNAPRVTDMSLTPILHPSFSEANGKPTNTSMILFLSLI